MPLKLSLRWTYLLITSLMIAMSTGARAQQPSTAATQPIRQFGWTFSVTPYLWLPSINATLNYHLPPALGGRLPTELSSGPGDYLPHLRFAAMGAAEARHERFSILTDFMHISGSVSTTNIRSLNFFGLPSRLISRSLQLNTSSSLLTTIWTMAGGYTILRGRGAISM